MLQYMYIAAMMNMSYYKPRDLGHFDIYISAYDQTEVYLYPPWQRFFAKRTLQHTTERWNYALTADTMEAISRTGFRIASSRPITIQVVFGKRRNTLEVAYTLFPVTAASTVFRLASYTKRKHFGFGPVFVVATGNQSAAIVTHELDVPGLSDLRFQMGPNQVREISATADVTGLKLTSTAPVAVFSGHQCANVPDSTQFCDPLFQQIPPESALGGEYYLGPILGRDSAVGFTARIVVSDPATTVYFEQSLGYSLTIVPSPEGNGDTECETTSIASQSFLMSKPGCFRRGRYLEVRASDCNQAMYVRCSMPCMAVLYNHGGKLDKARSDPFMTVLTPLDIVTNTVRFTTYGFYYKLARLEHVNFINIVVSGSNVSDLMVDGASVDERAFSSRSTQFMPQNVTVIALQITELGSHEIRARDQRAKLMVMLYGHGTTDINFHGYTSYGMTICATDLVSLQQSVSTSTETATLTPEWWLSSESGDNSRDPGTTYPSGQAYTTREMGNRSVTVDPHGVVDGTPHDINDRVYTAIIVAIATTMFLLAGVCLMLIAVYINRKKKQRSSVPRMYFDTLGTSEDHLTSGHVNPASDVISHASTTSTLLYDDVI